MAALIVMSAILFFTPCSRPRLWLIPPASAKPNEKAVSAVSETEFPNGDHAPDLSKFVKRIVVAPGGTVSKTDAGGIPPFHQSGPRRRAASRPTGWTPGCS